MKLNLDSFEVLKMFMAEVGKFEHDVNAKKGNYTIDAKSLLGIMSLGSLNCVEVELVGGSEEEKEKFNIVMKKYEVKE